MRWILLIIAFALGMTSQAEDKDPPWFGLIDKQAPKMPEGLEWFIGEPAMQYEKGVWTVVHVSDYHPLLTDYIINSMNELGRTRDDVRCVVLFTERTRGGPAFPTLVKAAHGTQTGVSIAFWNSSAAYDHFPFPDGWSPRVTLIIDPSGRLYWADVSRLGLPHLDFPKIVDNTFSVDTMRQIEADTYHYRARRGERFEDWPWGWQDEVANHVKWLDKMRVTYPGAVDLINEDSIIFFRLYGLEDMDDVLDRIEQISSKSMGLRTAYRLALDYRGHTERLTPDQRIRLCRMNIDAALKLDIMNAKHGTGVLTNVPMWARSIGEYQLALELYDLLEERYLKEQKWATEDEMQKMLEYYEREREKLRKLMTSGQ